MRVNVTFETRSSAFGCGRGATCSEPLADACSPSLSVIVRTIAYVPASTYVWRAVGSVVVSTAPSPKSHVYETTWLPPPAASLSCDDDPSKVTSSCARTLAGDVVNDAVGA